jgi:hypothetical protein
MITCAKIINVPVPPQPILQTNLSSQTRDSFGATCNMIYSGNSLTLQCMYWATRINVSTVHNQYLGLIIEKFFIHAEVASEWFISKNSPVLSDS